jgi:hypothetical protein
MEIPVLAMSFSPRTVHAEGGIGVAAFPAGRAVTAMEDAAAVRTNNRIAKSE